jgi:predicted CXXCH cytochrome family protein
MRARAAFVLMTLVLLATFAVAQVTTDVLGKHDFTASSGSSVVQSGSMGCTFCHAPHGGRGDTPLWNQTLSNQSYTPYKSTTSHQTGQTQPAIGTSTRLCLSCHDGTVGVGQSVAYGQLSTSGKISNSAVLNSNLNISHPFSLVLPVKDAANLAASIVAQGKTADPTGAVKLVNGNIECTSCHDPHVETIDKIAKKFLVRDSSAGQMCLACHDPSRTMSGQVNLLNGWPAGIHTTATNTASGQASVGSYANVAQNACDSCHQPHNAGSSTRLLRSATPANSSADPSSQPCVTCHNGSTAVTPSPPNVMAEFSKKTFHPFATSTGQNSHDPTEAVLLNGNRHSACADCHNPHAAQKPAIWSAPPKIREAQAGVQGISATDGATIVSPAQNQYESCFRCHGESTGKVADQNYINTYGYLPRRMIGPTDPLNTRVQFDQQYSSHPVSHPRTGVNVPSLRTTMTNIDGSTPASGGRTPSQIFCSDCHNSDDNREFGSTGAAGPHGSSYVHILERRYELAQAVTPGGPVTNVFKNPDLVTSAGPYALCAKCHDLQKLMTDGTFRHQPHVVTDGLSCSACHTAHGLGGTNANLSGDSLVDFDLNVVAQRNKKLQFDSGKRTCTLTCHNHNHNNSKY